MVLIDRVFQTVLSILNKEQRGYITPTEFNQLAIQAQKEIYEGYFFKLGRAVQAGGPIMPKVENIPYDIYQKLEGFEVSRQESYVNFATPIPIGDHYRLSIIQSNSVTIEKTTRTELGNLVMSELTEPTKSSPMYYRVGDEVFISGPTNGDIIVYFYYRELVIPNWVGATMDGQAVPNTADGLYLNFELHSSEEPELVASILSYAGVTVRDPGVSQAAATKQQQISQAES